MEGANAIAIPWVFSPKTTELKINILNGILIVFRVSNSSGRGGGSDGVLLCNTYGISVSGSDVVRVCVVPDEPPDKILLLLLLLLLLTLPKGNGWGGFLKVLGGKGGLSGDF